MLEVEGLEVRHGTLIAVRGVSLVVPQAGRVALLGLNGAGKSSLLAAIAGLISPTAGRVRMAGKDVTAEPAHVMVRLGVALVPERRDLFPQMSVAENLAMGSFARHDRAAAFSDHERVLGYFPVLRDRLKQAAYTLSGGEQQMLAIGRALLSRPQLLLLDEPSLGLAPKALKRIVEIIGRVNAEEGTAVMLVEQNTRMALEATDTAYVMETGRIVLSGASEALLSDDLVRRQLLEGTV
jgi:branched-chain amino acid transport system ATP-binding protein